MDGKTLLRDLRQFLQEASTSSFLDDKTSYDYLYKAAIEFVTRTRINTGTATITTVAGQAKYDLPADFLQMYLTDDKNRLFVKYNDGVSDTFINWRDFDPVVLANQTTSVPIPNTFSIVDSNDASRLSGTATATGTLTAPDTETILTDSTATFTDVWPGDIVHNTTDSSSGYVTVKGSGTSVSVVLFDGTTNKFTSADKYIITPQGRFAVVLDPAPQTSGQTVTVYYLKRPAPVYSPFRAYSFPVDYKHALILYAAWMYKNRDREPRYADYEYKYFDDQVRKASEMYGRAKNRHSVRVNMQKRAQQSGSWR